MTFQAYLLQFESLLNAENPPAPYDQPDYINYAKLNWSRMNRWVKQALPSAEIVQTMAEITEPQHWIVITEPWCGDAAQIIPFINMIAALNPLISVDYQLRDAEPFLINKHLTDGGKAIPKLVIQNESGHDIASWGPRPVECQVLYNKLKADGADFETMKTELQKWYNADRGIQIQEELNRLFTFLLLKPV
jgi:hypothetical protein